MGDVGAAVVATGGAGDDDELDPFAELERTSARRPRAVSKRIRSFLVVVHRWLSLGLTVWVVIISVSGAWLVFNQRFDAWLHAERYEQTDGDVGPAAVMTTVQDEVAADEGTVDFLVFPTNGRGVYQASATLPGPTDSETDDSYLVYYVDPGTGRVNGHKDYDEGFTAWMYRGHEFLWQDNGVAGLFDPGSGWCRRTGVAADGTGGVEPGGPKGVVCDVVPDGLDLIGWFGAGLVVIIATGFYLWYWPNVRRWATALVIKRGRGRFQFHLSLHKVVGLVVSVPLLVIAFTGVAFAFPNMKSWFENTTPATRDFAIWEPPGDLVSGEPDGREPLTADEFRDVVEARFPARKLISFNGAPFDETATWQAWMDRGHTNWTREGSGGNVLVAFDQYSGKLLYDGTPEDGNVFDQAWSDLQFPLHAGDFAGTSSRLVWFVVGLSPLLLMVSGVIMWWVRRKRVKAIKTRAAASTTDQPDQPDQPDEAPAQLTGA
jgi:uncharacterized iron-regulated membrane protein